MPREKTLEILERETIECSLDNAYTCMEDVAFLHERAIELDPSCSPMLQPILSVRLDPVKRALREGNKITAIKLYREATGVSLKEAKDIVEAMELTR
jgi:hypothetical protein